MKDTLFVVAPHGQQQCAGEYVKLPSEAANGQPVWAQRGGQFWLYSGSNGMWIIAGRDAKEKAFRCSHGLIFCRTLHAGVAPDRVKGVWERLDGENFVEDPSIAVSLKPRLAAALRVVSPNGQQRCEGDYVLTEMVANGLPVWQHQSGKCYLYCGSNSSWIFGGSDSKEKDFKCARGVIYSKNPSGGLMPEKIGGSWLRLAGEDFREDSAIIVCIKPQRLYVQSPNGHRRCAGEYVPLADRMANGYPIWEHVAGGRCWLYSGNNGMWIIGGTDALAKNFVCTRGVMYCQTLHQGQMPDKLAGTWHRLDGEKFIEDAAITVTTEPPSLHVISPKGHQRCGGEYRLVAERARHQPVWKQPRTHLRISSDADGSWMVCESDEVLLKCDQPHDGQTPDKVLGPWSRRENEKEMVKDDAIKVMLTSSIKMPGKLQIETPNGQQNCGGEYVLQGEMANGNPLWKQTGGKFWLYSGTNGLWIIGGGGAKRNNFDCSRGVIYSATPHGGLMPHQVEGLWLRLHGKEFLEDAKIQVSE